MIALTLVLLVAAAAAITDITSRRIPNLLPALLLCSGLALQATHGWQSAIISVTLFLSAFAFGTLLFSFNLLGGGDVKLIAAACAALGWPLAAAFLLYTIIAGGVLGISISVARGRLRAVVENLKAMTIPLLSGVRPAPITSAVGKMPYGLAIFAGAATVTVGNVLGLNLRIIP